MKWFFKQKVLKRILLILLMLILVLSIFLTFDNGTLVNSIRGEKENREATLYDGYCGGCHWTISDGGQLTIGAGVLENLANSGDAPWYAHKNYIKNVYVNSGVKTNTQKCVGLFYGLNKCTTISMANLDTTTKSTPILSHFFEGCTVLTSLTLPTNFVTSSVTNTSHMFKDCQALTTLDVSNFVTSSVTNMNSMFMDCYALTSITWGTFSTANVTDFGNLFSRRLFINSNRKSI